MSFFVAIPTRYPDIVAPLLKSIKKYEEEKIPILIIADGHNMSYGYEIITYRSPQFVFASAANIALMKAAKEDLDLFLINDDTRIIEKNTFGRLYDLAEIRQDVGILSPLIKGCVGGAVQHWYKRHMFWRIGIEKMKFVMGTDALCFPFVFIRAKMIRDIGVMSEIIHDYGGDDIAYCIKARKAGWRTAVTCLVTVQHGDGSSGMGEARGRTWSLSYHRRYGLK